MPKKAAGTRVDEDLYKRLERVAKVDRRTVANVIEICVMEYLPRLEAEVLHEDSSSPKPPGETPPIRYPALRPTKK